MSSIFHRDAPFYLKWYWSAIVSFGAMAPLGLLICVAYLFFPIPIDAPRIILPSQSHDFGSMLAESKSSFIFQGTNTLWDVLFIDRLDKSCGCTTASPDHIVILPGQSFSISATLSAPPYNEGLSSHITLHGHAGRRLVEQIYQLAGTVENAIEFPNEGGGPLNLGSWQLSQLPAVKDIMVTRGKYPLAFDELHAKCQSSALCLQIKPISKDVWNVSFRLNALEMLGTSGYPIQFTFGKKGKGLPQSVTQQAYLEILGPIKASPSSLLLTLSPGEHVQKTISISSRSGGSKIGALQIIDVTSSASNATATWQNNNESIVILDYTAPSRPGTDRGEMLVNVRVQQTSYTLKVGYLAIVS